MHYIFELSSFFSLCTFFFCFKDHIHIVLFLARFLAQFRAVLFTQFLAYFHPFFICLYSTISSFFARLFSLFNFSLTLLNSPRSFFFNFFEK